MGKIHVFHTHIEIFRYEMGDVPQLEKHLSIYDRALHKRIPLGYEYNEENKTLYIPRGVNLKYLERLFNEKPVINYTADSYDKVSIKLKTMPRDEVQQKSIAFLTGHGEFNRTLWESQLLLQLDPGVGKTYITIASLTVLGLKPIIITHTLRIEDQWIDSFKTMTDLNERDILIIRGTKMMEDMMSVDPSKIKQKVYLVNHKTFAQFMKKYGGEKLREFFQHMKFGIKIYDEAHLNFQNTLRIDYYSNTKMTIYLTATFSRSIDTETKLFRTVFSDIISYGAEHKNKDENKHMVYVSMLYNSKPGYDQIAYMNTFKGFSKMRYSEYTISCPKFIDVLLQTVNYFIVREGKMLVLSSKIDSANTIADILKEKFPNKRISTFHSKVSIEDKVFALEADIICSTPQSAGTGVDIPGLRTLIMTESYSSLVEAEQVSGRLRPYKGGTENTFYVELVDEGFDKVKKAFKKRLPVFHNKCVKVLSLKL